MSSLGLGRTRVVGAVVLAAAFVAACSAAPSAAPTSPPSTQTAAGSPAASAAGKCPNGIGEVTMAVGGTPGIAEQVIPQALGYYAQEACVNVKFLAIPNSLGLINGLTSGKANYSGIHPSATLTAMAQSGVDIPSVAICEQTHGTTWEIGVKTDNTTIKSVSDLRGKKIGTPNFANSETFGLKNALQSVGIDPDKDVEIIQISTGAAFANALQTGQVDAAIAGDIEFALDELLDPPFHFTLLPHPDSWSPLTGYAVNVSREYLNTHKDEIAGVCRAMVMGQIFAITNPEAAAKLFWQQLPETKGTGDAAALARTVAQIATRSRAWTTCGSTTDCPGFKWGANKVEGWAAYASFLDLTEKLKNIDLTTHYSNEFVDKVNDGLDVNGIVQFAKSYTVN
jgi:NitT/TauT family transport system substrate-binding protein